MTLIDILCSPTALIIYAVLVYSYIHLLLPTDNVRDHNETKVNENF